MKMWIIITLIVGWSGLTHAQSLKESYWVVEGNVNNPTYTIIRFYDGNDILIKEETLRGKFINIRKKRNRDFLNRKLAMINQSLNAYVHSDSKK